MVLARMWTLQLTDVGYSAPPVLKTREDAQQQSGFVAGTIPMTDTTGWILGQIE